jgi:hypothetical protein
MCFELCADETELELELEWGWARTYHFAASSPFQFSRQALLCFDTLLLCSLERATHLKVPSVLAVSHRSVRRKSPCPDRIPPNEFGHISIGTFHNHVRTADQISSSHLHSLVRYGCNRQTDGQTDIPLDHIITKAFDNSAAQFWYSDSKSSNFPSPAVFATVSLSIHTSEHKTASSELYNIIIPPNLHARSFTSLYRRVGRLYWQSKTLQYPPRHRQTLDCSTR